MTRRTIVKICGITRLEDARTAFEAGADWIGLILWEGSPRRVSADAAAEIVAALTGVTAVAVLVSPTPEQALEQATRIGAHRVQLHRVDPASWPTGFPLPVTFALGVEEDGSLRGALPRERDLLMLDTARPGLVGGTGTTFPWAVAARYAATRPVLLAGGLDAGNVALALEHVRPYGVDSASRLEMEPGLKDPDAVRRFVAAVRTWDANNDAGT